MDEKKREIQWVVIIYGVLLTSSGIIEWIYNRGDFLRVIVSIAFIMGGLLITVFNKHLEFLKNKKNKSLWEIPTGILLISTAISDLISTNKANNDWSMSVLSIIIGLFILGDWQSIIKIPDVYIAIISIIVKGVMVTDCFVFIKRSINKKIFLIQSYLNELATFK